MATKKVVKKELEPETISIERADGTVVTFPAPQPPTFSTCIACQGKGTIMEGHRLCKVCDGLCVVKD